MRRRTPATDFTPAALEAFRAVVADIEGIHGAPRWPVEPLWIGGVRRVSTIWFLPVDGVSSNHGMRLDESGRGPVGAAPAVPRFWTLSAWNHRGLISHVEFSFREAPGTWEIRNAAQFVGLLPKLMLKSEDLG